MQEFICEYTLIENYHEPSERWITEVVVKDNYEEAYQFYLAIVESMHRDIQMYDFLNRRIFSSITIAEVSAMYPNGKVIHYYNKSQIEEQIAKENEIREAVSQSGIGYSSQRNPMVVQGGMNNTRYHKGYEEKPFYSKMFNGWKNHGYPQSYGNQYGAQPQRNNYDLYYLNQLNSRNGQAYMPRQQSYQPIQVYQPPLPQQNVYVNEIANRPMATQPCYVPYQYPQTNNPQSRNMQFQNVQSLPQQNVTHERGNIPYVQPIGAPNFKNVQQEQPQDEEENNVIPPPSPDDLDFREGQIFDGSPDPDQSKDRQIIMMSLTGNEIDSIFDGDYDVVFGEAPAEDFDRVIVYDLDADAVVGEFDVSEVVTDDKKVLWKDFKNDSPMKHSNYKKFFKGLDDASAIISVNPFFYQNEKTLEDFRMDEAPDAYEYLVEVF